MPTEPIKGKNILSQHAITGCLDVLCKAHAQIAPVDDNLAEEISNAIETIMQAYNTDELPAEDLDVIQAKGGESSKLINMETIVDIFTGEILYKGLK